MMRLIGRASALSAVGLMALSAFTFAQGVAQFTAAVWLAIGGSVMVGVAKLTSPPDPARTRHAVSLQYGEGESSRGMMVHARTNSIRWGWLMAGIVALATLATINGLPQEDNDLLLIGWLWYVPSQIQFVLLWGGIAMVVWAFKPHSLTPTPASKGRETLREAPLPRDDAIPPQQESARFVTWENGLLAAILLLALALRVWNLEGAIHRYIDEIHFANAVVRLSDEANNKILLPFGEVTAFTWVFPHFEWLSVRLFGASLASLRLPSAVIGTLNVLAIYWLAKALFDRKTALLAALLLATFPPHIHFSRLALNNIADPLFGTLALAFVAKAITRHPSPLRTRYAVSLSQGEGEKSRAHVGALYITPLQMNTQMYWLLAGVCLGMTQYFYDGGKLLFPPLLLAWVIWMMVVPYLLRPLERLRQTWVDVRAVQTRNDTDMIHHAPTLRGVLILVVVALMVVAPLYYALASSYHLFSTRLYFTAWLTNPQHAHLATPDGFTWHVVQSIPYAFASFVQLKDASWFYGGQTALILPLLVPLFLLGLAQAVWRVLSPGGLLLLLWIAGTVLGNSVLSEANHFPRYVVVFPALALTMAVGARYTWAMIFEPPRRQARQEVSNQQSAVSTQPMHNRNDVLVGTQHAASLQERFGLLRQSSQQPAASGRHFTQSSVLFLLVLILAFAQAGYYFGTHVGQFFLQNRLSKDTDDALFRALDLPTDTDVFIVGKQILWSYNVNTVLRFYGRGDLHVLSYAPSGFALVLPNLPLNRDYAFFVEPEDLDTARLLRERFGDIGAPQVSPFDVPMDKHYVMYWVEGQ